MTRLSETYSRIRSRTSNIGMIVIGVALILVSFFIRTDLFETILDIVGILGILVGLVITAAGIYWFGDEKGWWYRELISEVVEIEKAQVRERAYPPGITNRR